MVVWLDPAREPKKGFRVLYLEIRSQSFSFSLSLFLIYFILERERERGMGEEESLQADSLRSIPRPMRS